MVLGFIATTETHINLLVEQIKMNKNKFYSFEVPLLFAHSRTTFPCVSLYSTSLDYIFLFWTTEAQSSFKLFEPSIPQFSHGGFFLSFMPMSSPQGDVCCSPLSCLYSHHSASHNSILFACIVFTIWKFVICLLPISLKCEISCLVDWCQQEKE